MGRLSKSQEQSVDTVDMVNYVDKNHFDVHATATYISVEVPVKPYNKRYQNRNLVGSDHMLCSRTKGWNIKVAAFS